MPVSRKNPPRNGNKVRDISVGINAGAVGAMRALRSMADGYVDNSDLVALQGFFWGYTLAVTRSSREPICDVPWVNRMLNKIEYNMPVSTGEILRLKHYAELLLKQAKQVRDMKLWVSALNDMETYAIMHGWKWSGIGERKA